MGLPKGYVRPKVATCSMPGCNYGVTERNKKGVCARCQRYAKKGDVERVAKANGYTPPPPTSRTCKMDGCTKALNRGNRSGYCEGCQRAGAWKLGPFTDMSPNSVGERKQGRYIIPSDQRVVSREGPRVHLPCCGYSAEMKNLNAQCPRCRAVWTCSFGRGVDPLSGEASTVAVRLDRFV